MPQEHLADGSAQNTASVSAAVVTQSSGSVLRFLRSYVSLLAPLAPARTALWLHFTELFDSYVLAVFVLFGGVTLETLAWEEDCLPHRWDRAGCTPAASVARGQTWPCLHPIALSVPFVD